MTSGQPNPAAAASFAKTASVTSAQVASRDSLAENASTTMIQQALPLRVAATPAVIYPIITSQMEWLTSQVERLTSQVEWLTIQSQKTNDTLQYLLHRYAVHTHNFNEFRAALYKADMDRISGHRACVRDLHEPYDEVEEHDLQICKCLQTEENSTAHTGNIENIADQLSLEQSKRTVMTSNDT